MSNTTTTGIVRRIDDLGRIVIPKEIRQTMRINEGDPLEIAYGSERQLILTKYHEKTLADRINQIATELKNDKEWAANLLRYIATEIKD